MPSRLLGIFVWLCLCFSMQAGAAHSHQQNEPLVTRLVSEQKGIVPGECFWVAVEVKLSPTWHTYWKNPGETGTPTQLEWNLPEGFVVNDVLWPAPKKLEDMDMVYYGYEGKFVILAQLSAPEELTSKNVEIGTALRWLACNEESCHPGDTEDVLKLPILKVKPGVDKARTKYFTKAREALPKRVKAGRARQLSDHVEICLESDDSPTPKSIAAHFIHEESDLMDPRAEVSINHQQDDTLHLHIAHQGTLPTLKGLLLIQQSDDSNDIAAIEIDIPLENSETEISPTPPSDSDYSLATILLFAFVGGTILNLMPCVLPVISFKVMSLIKMAGEERSQTLKHGGIFALGVLTAFWILGGILLGMRAYGQSVGWGFQLQDPFFVGLLTALMVVMGLSLFGLFEIGTSLSSWAGQQENQVKSKEGPLSSFLSGMLATVVATPCSGPFLGTAYGMTLFLPPFSAMLVFTFVGLGMAAPFVAMTAYPSLMRLLPKPGAWMGPFKQLMGFFLIATALWLVWVFSVQTGSDGVIVLLGGLLVLSFACWIYGTYATPLKKKTIRTSAIIATLLIGAVGLKVIHQASEVVSLEQSQGIQNEFAWNNYTRDALEQARSEGRPVFVDYTAKWCMICQANHLVLVVDEVEKVFQEKGVVKFKADLTRPNDEIQEDLRRFGRSGVPLYLLYLPDQDEPIVLPQVLTPEIVLNSLKKMEAHQG